MKAFDYKKSFQILSEGEKLPAVQEKVIYIFAGPNGSGKSTYIANKYQNGSLKVPYVNADIYCKTLFASIEDEDERNKKAMFFTMEKTETLIREGKAFCYETVLSHPSKLEIVKLAKKQGYKIISSFIFTSDPNINVKRVAERARQGGHDVPKDKIISRYYRSIENCKQLKELSDNFYSFDNSDDMRIEKFSDFQEEIIFSDERGENGNK